MNPDIEVLKQSAEQASALLKSMSNSHRLIVLCALLEGELSVNEINSIVPLSQSALSQHLAALRKSELVTTRRDSQTIFYSLKNDAVVKIIQVLKETYCE